MDVHFREYEPYYMLEVTSSFGNLRDIGSDGELASGHGGREQDVGEEADGHKRPAHVSVDPGGGGPLPPSLLITG